FGGVDIVVANAGIAPTPAPLRAMTSAEFERVVEVNLLGVYRTVRAGMEQLVARQGQAVLVSSVYAFMNGTMLSPYAVAKAGIEQRRGRVIAPRFWTAMSVLRGVVNPAMDYAGTRAEKLQKIVREADRPADGEP